MDLENKTTKLERKVEIAEMVEKVRDGFKGRKRNIGDDATASILLRNTMKYHKNTLKSQNICATLLIGFGE